MKMPESRQSFATKAMLNAIGNQVASAVPPQVIESYRELIAVGEAEVALENLCSNLIDLEVQVPQPTIAAIRDACETLGVALHWYSLLTSEF
jgi:hypothetical protein